LRLLAFLLVFVHQAGLDIFGSHSKLSIIDEACGSGLQLFFLLSSYLITELLLREREKTGLIHLRALFTRRILRIWPLYFFFIGLSLLISKTTNFQVLTNSQFLAYLIPRRELVDSLTRVYSDYRLSALEYLYRRAVLHCLAIYRSLWLPRRF
jgi:peptidoglycan/LPS O-acetylase OafA/YrhL